MWANPENMPTNRTVLWASIVLLISFIIMLAPAYIEISLLFLVMSGVVFGVYKFLNMLYNFNGNENVKKPWGGYRNVADGPRYKIKILVVMPNEAISLQSHKYRREIWTITQGEGAVEYGVSLNNLKDFKLKVGDTLNVLEGAMHRITNNGDVPLVITEVWLGETLLEDDITRYEDRYGRV